MPTYQEYPVVLQHPSHTPARKIADAVPAIPPQPGQPLIPGAPEKWEAERFPNITVMTADDEAFYTAKGYTRPGQANKAAFDTAYASPYVAGRKTEQWPKVVNGMVVQDPDAPTSNFRKYPMWVRPPSGGEPVLANNATEEEAILGPPEDRIQAVREAVADDFAMIPDHTLKLKKKA